MLELLNAVSIAKRMANMSLHADGFGAKQERNKKKNLEKAGLLPPGTAATSELKSKMRGDRAKAQMAEKGVKGDKGGKKSKSSTSVKLAKPKATTA